MMSNFVKRALFALAIFGFAISCSMPAGLEGGSTSSVDSRSVVSEYVDRLLDPLSNGAPARAVASGDYSESMLPLPDVQDAEGNPLDLSALPPEGRKMFLEQTRDAYVDRIMQVADDHPETLADIMVKNEALGDLLKTMKPSDEGFAEAYAAKLEAMADQRERLAARLLRSARSAAEAGGAARALSPAKALSALRAQWRVGRILFTTGTSSSASLFAMNPGHTAVCVGPNGHETTWDTRWERTVYTPIASSSWGNDLGYKIGYSDPGNINMPSMTSKPGAGRENLAYWTNQVSGVPIDYFSIYEVGKDIWVWDWFNSGFRWHGAGDGKGRDAANWALGQVRNRTPYNLLIVNQFREDCYYCSSFVWRAWEKQGFDTDGNILPWVAPTDIVNNRGKTRRMVSVSP